jgi:hypothetical protein
VDKSIGKGKPAVGADPVAPGQLHGDPPFHALALDQDGLAFKRKREGRPEMLSQFFNQDFQSVAGIEL